MSTTTPAADTPTTTEAETTDTPTTETADTRTTTGTERSDRWADASADARTSASATAPRTFDPFHTRRLRNCVDRENAAFPDGDWYGLS